ncbi:hypothetical protein LXL04_012492 [Taraxacum kok-saghyz]
MLHQEIHGSSLLLPYSFFPHLQVTLSSHGCCLTTSRNQISSKTGFIFGSITGFSDFRGFQGLSHMAYPGAVHSRFEHSFGVYWLAGNVVEKLKAHQLRRKQFLVRLCFAMTINKAQGQTIPNVGVYLPEPVFSHGQLYVALSRGISRGNTKVLVKSVEKSNVDEVYTSNVVYKEVLSD